MNSKFLPINRDQNFLLPPSVQDWLSPKHEARFIVDIINELDLTEFQNQYSPLGRKAYPIEIMLGIIFYGYITGIFSSRKLEKATYDSLAFRFIASNMHPDHDSIADFRKFFCNKFENIFLQILKIASELNVLKLGNVSLDGTKIKANASKHKAISWEYANKLEAQLKDEVAKLHEMAMNVEEQELKLPKENIPDELARREARLVKIGDAKKKIEERAQQRYEIEKKEYDEKIASRAEKEALTGKKIGGKAPKVPVPGPRKKDQVNFTDEDSRIMPKANGAFEQSYNAQAVVDYSTMLIVANKISQNTNDKLEMEDAINEIKKAEATIGQKVEGISADPGYFSKDNVNHCEKNDKIPYIVDNRDKHNKTLEKRFENQELPIDENADSVQKMKHRLKTPEGKKVYSKRKTTVEPTFGIVKTVIGFDTFSLRGIEAVSGEWDLVCAVYNIKKLFNIINRKCQENGIAITAKHMYLLIYIFKTIFFDSNSNSEFLNMTV
jgi:transposase